LGNLAQLGYAVKLSVEVQYILAIEALAGLDEVQVVFLELPEFDHMVFGALELGCISSAPTAALTQMTYEFVLLPEGGVDLKVGRPKFLFNLVGRGVFEIGDRQAFAGGAISVGVISPAVADGRSTCTHSWSAAASSAHAAPPSARL
jgi:hypothetical protein